LKKAKIKGNLMVDQFRRLLEILEKSSIIIFEENPHLFKENTAFTALLLQGLVHSPNKTYFLEIIKNLIDNLINIQDQIEGYFIEKHANYSEPSALVSALAGIALIDSMDFVSVSIQKQILDSLKKIYDFLISQEIDKGYYRKSFGFNFSIVNSNVSIALFMTLYYKITKKEELLNKINDFIDILNYCTLKNGALPYGIYGQKYFVPSIYYHALTLNHLIRINLLFNSKKLSNYLKFYLDWIKSCYDSNGIRWEKSGFLFSTYLNQTYCFILAINKVLSLAGRDNIFYEILKKNIHKGILFRCDKTPRIIKRISIGIHVGLNSSKSIKIKFMNNFLLILYSLLLKFNIKAKPRIYKINPIFKYLGIHSRVSPPISNSLDYMTTIESYCYIALAYDLSTRTIF